MLGNGEAKTGEIRASLNSHEKPIRKPAIEEHEPTRPGSSETSRRHPISCAQEISHDNHIAPRRAFRIVRRPRRCHHALDCRSPVTPFAGEWLRLARRV